MLCEMLMSATTHKMRSLDSHYLMLLEENGRNGNILISFIYETGKIIPKENIYSDPFQLPCERPKIVMKN